MPTSILSPGPAHLEGILNRPTATAHCGYQATGQTIWHEQYTDRNRIPMKTATASTPTKRPRILAGTVPPLANGTRALALSNYEAALRLMQSGKFDKASVALQLLLANSPADLTERIRMYINACAQQIAKGKKTFLSGEEQYDYAISLLNEGHYDDARDQLKQIISDNPQADYGFYGLAVLSSMTGDSHHCLEHLTESIRLNPRNRIQARADSDFQDMADDPRFTELLYPEV
jgi:TolA-binding protein